MMRTMAQELEVIEIVQNAYGAMLNDRIAAIEQAYGMDDETLANLTAETRELERKAIASLLED